MVLIAFILLNAVDALAQKTEVINYGKKYLDTFTRVKMDPFQQNKERNFKTDNEGQTVEQLKKVTINSEKGLKNYEALGYHERPGFFRRLFNRPDRFVIGGNDKITAIATYIEPKHPSRATFLETIYLKAYSRDSSNLATIQVYLYPIDIERKIIGEDLLHNDFILKLNTDQEFKEIDIRDEKIRMPKKGVLVVLKKINESGIAPWIELKKPTKNEFESYFFQSNPKKIYLTKAVPLEQNFRVGFKSYFFKSG